MQTGGCGSPSFIRRNTYVQKEILYSIYIQKSSWSFSVNHADPRWIAVAAGIVFSTEPVAFSSGGDADSDSDTDSDADPDYCRMVFVSERG